MKKKFDYSKTYYKVTNIDEFHREYQYKDGLNVLEEKFNDNPKASCVPGGFYFTDYENLPNFFIYGIWIREVTIPEDAKVIKDPEGDKWRTDKIIFGKKYHINNDFDKWFDKEKFNWKNSYILAIFCSEHFDKWFDTEKYNWEFSEYLAQYCQEHFDKWFDKEKFNWEYSYILAQYCSKDFDKWFDPEKFDWEYSHYLTICYSNHFDKWFDSEKFDWSNSHYLAQYCSQYFDKWFDPEKFDWRYSPYLAEYCSKHKNKWKKYVPKDF